MLIDVYFSAMVEISGDKILIFLWFLVKWASQEVAHNFFEEMKGFLSVKFIEFTEIVVFFLLFACKKSLDQDKLKYGTSFFVTNSLFILYIYFLAYL